MSKSKLILVLAVACATACSSRTDITRSDSDVEEWVAEQKAEEKRKRDALGPPAGASEPRPSGQPPASAPDAEPAPRGVPEQAPPPRRGPSPAKGTGGTQASQRTVGSGTCFAVDGKGTVVTAHHVIEGAEYIGVAFGAEEPLAARVVRASSSTDVAVLQVDRATSHFLPIAAPQTARVGMDVFTMGFPVPDVLGAEPKFTDGAISSLSGVGGEASLMQISVPIQSGNSGGPLVTDQGEVVGITVAAASARPFLQRTGSLPQNVNFAAKSETLLTLLSEPPATAPRSKSRRDAIDRAAQSICLVAVVKPSR